MARSNRAARRRQHRPDPRLAYERIDTVVRTLPGLPGGPEYTPEEIKFEVMAKAIDALREMTPYMAYRVMWWHRVMLCDPPRLPRLRQVHETVDGVGRGVVLGEFTNEPVHRLSLAELTDLRGLKATGGRVVKHRSVGMSTTLWLPEEDA